MLKIILLFWMFVFLVGLIGTIPAGDGYILVMSSVFLGYYASNLLYYQYRTKNLVSPLALYSFLFIVHYSIPGIMSLYNKSGFGNIDNFEYAGFAQIYIVIGFAFFHFGVKTVNDLFRNNKLALIQNASDCWGSKRVYFVVFLLMTIGWISRFYIIDADSYFQISRDVKGDLEGSFYALIKMMEYFPRFGLMILVIQFAGLKYKNKYLLLGLVFCSELIYWLPTGRKEDIILTMALPFMVDYLVNRRLPSKKNIFIIVTLIIFIFPLTHFYRVAMDVGGERNSDLITAVTESIKNAKDADHEKKNSYEVVLGRISLIESTAASMRMVNEGLWDVSFGESYWVFVPGLVPRFIWGDKPKLDFGNEFGHASGILSETNLTTSISITYVGESFLNFSWSGGVVMYFFGVFFTILYNMAKVSRKRKSWLLVYTMAIPVILYIGGSFAMYFLGLTKLIVFAYVLSSVMAYKTRYIYRNTGATK